MAQEIEPLLNPNKTWSCYGDYFFLNVKYRLGDDTVMNGKSYKKVFAHGSDVPYDFDWSEAQYKSALREENGKVIVVEKNFITEHVLYDFNKTAGDTIRFYRPIGDFNQGVLPQYDIGKVYKTDMVTIQGFQRKRLFIHDPFMVDQLPTQALNGLDSQADIWIEGLGGRTGLFSRMPDWGVVGPEPYLLTCVSDNGNLIYLNNTGYDASSEDPCFIVPPEGSNTGGGGGSTGGSGNDTTGSGGNDSLILSDFRTDALSFQAYPNPAQDFVTISPVRTQKATATISDLFGNRVKVITLRVENNRITIPLSDINAGVYQLILETSEGNYRCRIQVK